MNGGHGVGAQRRAFTDAGRTTRRSSSSPLRSIPPRDSAASVQRVPDASAASLTPFIRDAVELSSTSPDVRIGSRRSSPTVPNLDARRPARVSVELRRVTIFPSDSELRQRDPIGLSSYPASFPSSVKVPSSVGAAPLIGSLTTNTRSPSLTLIGLVGYPVRSSGAYMLWSGRSVPPTSCL